MKMLDSLGSDSPRKSPSARASLLYDLMKKVAGEKVCLVSENHVTTVSSRFSDALNECVTRRAPTKVAERAKESHIATAN